MPDSDSPNVGHEEEPTDDVHQGGLLFDPTAVVPLDAAEGFDPFGHDEPEAPSKSPMIVVGIMLVVALGAGAMFVSRGSDVAGTPTLPPMVEPLPGTTTVQEAITPIPTANLRGAIGSTVRVAVRVTGQTGSSIADTLVAFSVETGNGLLEETEVRTNQDGVAATALTLPSRPGATVLLARVDGSALDPGRIVVTATPGTPASLSIVSGNGQSAEIGELLPTRVYVSLADEQGNPVPNAEIRFDVVTGDGITAPSQTRTDSLGRASALWRLGMIEGPQRLSATSTDILAQVSFGATALPPTTTARTGEGGAIEMGPVRVAPMSYAVGGSHVCALRGGVLSCRGGNDRGQTGGNGANQFIAVVAGAAHSCGLDATGAALCWGANEGGQLGDGTRVDKPRPTAVRTELRFSVLATGSSHTCGLAGGGIPLCWGLNLSGQLGDGTRNDQTAPRTVGGGLDFRTLTAGWSHTCGLTSNGNAFCWGLNSQGQLGDGSTLDRLVPTLVRGAVETLVAGSAHTCGISQGEVLCWGGNTFGQLGDGTSEGRAQPVTVKGLAGAPTDLAAGAVHSCALAQGGRAYCWGQNLNGQLGDGTMASRSTAVAVSGGLTFTEIHAGGAQTCARTADGTWYCWGLNQSGQLGDGTRASRQAPTRVGG